MITRRLDLTLPTLVDFVPDHISVTPMASGYNAATSVTHYRVIQEVTKRLAQYGNGKGVTTPFTMRLVTALR